MPRFWSRSAAISFPPSYPPPPSLSAAAAAPDFSPPEWIIAGPVLAWDTDRKRIKHTSRTLLRSGEVVEGIFFYSVVRTRVPAWCPCSPRALTCTCFAWRANARLFTKPGEWKQKNVEKSEEKNVRGGRRGIRDRDERNGHVSDTRTRIGVVGFMASETIKYTTTCR